MQLSFEPTRAPLTEFFRDIASCREKGTLTHSLHPYPAKFIPHIPRALIAEYGRLGESVLDPMCGSGTTLVEASAAGYKAIGVDLNPIAAMVAKAKTTILNSRDHKALSKVARRSNTLAAEVSALPVLLETSVPVEAIPTFHRRDHWFHLHVSRELVRVLEIVSDLQNDNQRNFALCALSAILVGVSNQESETRWCARPKEMPVGETLRRFAARLLVSLERARQYADTDPTPATVIRGDARDTGIAAESVGLVVTSPPYANAHDYYLYNKLRMFWLGHDVRPVQTAEIGSRHRHSDKKEGIDIYLDEMTGVLSEMERVLMPQGKAVIVVADAIIRGEFISMDKKFAIIGEKTGLHLSEKFQFSHQRFNSTFQRTFGSSVTKATHVLVFQK